MKEIALTARRRQVFGKRVRALRREGKVPARVYGPHTPPLPVELDNHEFQRVWAKAGSLSIVNLQVEGQRQTVLIREVQREATTGKPLHVDLYAIALTDRLRANVPIVLAGEAPATRRGGVLLRMVDTLEVESLPADLPHQIEIDVTGLEDFDSGIHVKDIVMPKGVDIHTPADELVVKVATPTVEVEEVITPPEVPAEAAEKPAAPEQETEAGTEA